MNIETNLAVSLLLLTSDDLKSLQEFIFEFAKIKEDKKFSWVSFVDSVVSELKIVEYKGYLYHKHYVKVEYRDIINKYDKILRKLIQLEILLPIYRIISDEESKKQFVEFSDYLLKNEDKQAVMMENLYKVKQLGINEFNYVPDNSLDDIYDMHICKSPEPRVYSVRGIASDGDKIWLPQEVGSKYEFFLRGANYLIEYRKNTLVKDSVNMVVKNLTFDPNSLPDKEELYDPRILPNVDYDEITRKNKEKKFQMSTSDIIMSSRKLKNKLSEYMSYYDAEYLSDEDLIELNDLMNGLSELCLYVSVIESKNLEGGKTLKKVKKDDF